MYCSDSTSDHIKQTLNATGTQITVPHTSAFYINMLLLFVSKRDQ